MGQYNSTFPNNSVDWDPDFAVPQPPPFLNAPGTCHYYNGGLYQVYQYAPGAGPIAYALHNLWYIKGIPSEGTYVASDRIADSHINLPAGISNYATQPTSGYAVWLQRSGQGNAVVDAVGSLAIGDNAIGSSTDGEVTKMAAGTAPTNAVIARANAAAAASGDRAVWLAMTPLP